MKDLKTIAANILVNTNQDSKKVESIYTARRYEYFKQLVNMIPLQRDHQAMAITKLLCVKGSVKNFEDVCVGYEDLKLLIKMYNDDDSNKFQITWCNTSPKSTKYYLNIRPKTKSKSKPAVINVSELVKEASKIDRNTYCINWVIKTIVNRFNIQGYGVQIIAKDLTGKNHSFCEKTRFYIMNSHVAEAKRRINSNPEKYGFYIDQHYKISAIDNNIGWN